MVERLLDQSKALLLDRSAQVVLTSVSIAVASPHHLVTQQSTVGLASGRVVSGLQSKLMTNLNTRLSTS